jgi:hypothetical protein
MRWDPAYAWIFDVRLISAASFLGFIGCAENHTRSTALAGSLALDLGTRLDVVVSLMVSTIAGRTARRCGVSLPPYDALIRRVWTTGESQVGTGQSAVSRLRTHQPLTEAGTVPHCVTRTQGGAT